MLLQGFGEMERDSLLAHGTSSVSVDMMKREMNRYTLKSVAEIWVFVVIVHRNIPS